MPSCRFWFFHVKCFGRKTKRRRGKALVSEPFTQEEDDRNQQYRCQVKREQPFWSTSDDICQVTDRCNVDYQFLFCAPLPSSKIEAVPESTPEAHSEGRKRRRLTEQSPEMLKQMRADRPS